MKYSQVDTGNGEVDGLSLNSPPYSQSESHECHRYPSATAGGPDGCGRPDNAGEAISQVFVRSRVKKLLSRRVQHLAKLY